MTGRLVAALIGLTILVGGCGGVQSLSFPTPPPTPPPPPSTTVPPNLTGVSLAPVAGQATTTTVELGPGGATINGTVLGPQGPVGGADVEADRLVGDAQATRFTTSAADGSFSFAGVLGGRYRVRAWQTPTLAMTSPQIFFLAGSETHTLSLTVMDFAGSQITAAIAPDPPTVGDPANLVVQVVTPTVDPHGVVLYTPVAGATVTLTNAPALVVIGANPVTTSGGGEALFEVVCEAAGSPGLTAAVSGLGARTLSLPGCMAQPSLTVPPTTTTLPGAGTGSTPTTNPFQFGVSPTT